MPQYLAPGVYVEETSFRSKAIEGVATSTTGFVGPCAWGPVSGVPEVLTSLGDFERLYGDGQPLAFGPAVSPDFLWHAARSFFDNGGHRLHVSRVFQPLSGAVPADLATTTPGDAPFADGHARGVAGGQRIVARHPGAMGNLQVRLMLRLGAALPSWTPLVDGDVVWVSPSAAVTSVRRVQDLPLGIARRDNDGTWHVNGAVPAPASVQLLTLTLETLDAQGRVLANWSGLWPGAGRGIERLLARFGLDARVDVPVVLLDEGVADGLALVQSLASGLDWQLTPAELAAAANDERLAWRKKFESGVTITAPLIGGNDGLLPGAAAYDGVAEPVTGLQALAAVDDIAMVAAPGSTWQATQRAAEVLATMAALIAHAERLRYRIALLDAHDAMSVSDVRELRRKMDSRHAALYYPWVTVAGPLGGKPLNLPPSGFVAGICARVDTQRGVFKAPANEVVIGAIGFEKPVNTAEQEVLNPEGINCLRFFEGRGFRVWGARTVSSDPAWKYVNQRRYFAYLERSLDVGTQWAVFEPNGEALWANVRQTINSFLLNEWQRGALLGEKPEKAFFVHCDRTTMTQSDLDNGRLVIHVGVAMVKPAEFVIFRVGQSTADAKT